MTNFRVGEWTVEPDLGRVSRGATKVNLQPQVMQLLVFLAENHNTVISIETMITEVWHGRPMTSGSVYNSLNGLRNAFGDDHHQPRYIETIPKKGYRLIAEVVFDIDDQQQPESSSPVQKNDLTVRHPSSRLSRIIAGILVLGFAYLVWVNYLAPPDVVLSEHSGEQPADFSAADVSVIEADFNSLAVLPFLDLSAEGDQQYFADGISEEILNLIAGQADLKVVGRTSSFQFRGRNVGLKEIGRTLNVAHILEGSVRRYGDNLRVTAQLIKASDGYHVWSKTFDAVSGDIFSVQDEIAFKVAQSLQATLSKATGESQPPSQVLDLELYDLILLARHRVHRGSENDVLEAIDYLERAIELYPNSAQAYAELAWAYSALRKYASSDELRGKFEEGPVVHVANLALEIDPNLADAHAALGMDRYIKAWNGSGLPETAIKSSKSFARALELNPNLSRAIVWYSGLKRFQGSAYVEAVELAKRGVELEPLWMFAIDYYLSLVAEIPAYRAEKWALVRKLKSQALQEFIPSATAISVLEGELLFNEGRLAESVGLLQNLEPEEGNDRKQWLYLARGQSFLGEKTENVSKDHLTRLWHLLVFLNEMPTTAKTDCPLELMQLQSTHAISACSYVSLLQGQTNKTLELLQKYLPADLEQFNIMFRHTFFNPTSIGITTATVHKLLNDHEKADFYIDLTEKFLSGVTDDYTLESVWASRTRAYLHALRGENEQAIEQLAEAIRMGERDFRVFMHPAFNDLREQPAFIVVLERWMALINEERLRLGLKPHELNYKVGVGVHPFKIDNTTE